MSSRKTLLIVILILVVMSLQACSSDVIRVDASPEVPTIASANFTLCPPVTPISSPVLTKPRVIYVLIDRSGSYGKYTDDAIDVLVESLRASVKFGDRLHLIWLGDSETPDDYLLVETVPTQPFPILETPPPPFAISSPPILQTNTPTEKRSPSSELQAQSIHLTETAEAIANMQTATVESVKATNTAIYLKEELNTYYCKQTDLNTRNKNSIETWENTQQEVVNDFVSEVLLPLQDETFTGKDQGTHIYNALFYAARAIRQEKASNQFSAYYLIIFSDMDDIGSKKGVSLEVDLENVNVFFPMLYCLHPVDCQDRQIYWTEYFQEHGAILPPEPFWTIRETNPSLIIDFLNKEEN